MTPSAIGALPLGTIVTSRADKGTLKFAFTLYKTLLNERSFYGRGAVGPKIALTDDSDKIVKEILYNTLGHLCCSFFVFFMYSKQFGDGNETKYLFKKTNIDTSLIENLRKKMFKVDMTLGLCECAMGLSKGPCKHKHIVAKHFDVASLHTIPSDSEIMRAFYHFLWHWCS